MPAIETMEKRTVRVWTERYAYEDDFAGLCEKTDTYSEYVVDVSRDLEDPEEFEDEYAAIVTIVKVPVAA